MRISDWSSDVCSSDLVIVPPLTSQYLNLTKNSSLAVVIGYPDLVSVFSGTVLNQTGQAVEVIAIPMAVYRTISLIISLFMNWSKIGSASCRERVSQYVWLSVASVPLKQKNAHTAVQKSH